MSTLAKANCQACRAGALSACTSEVEEWLLQIPKWSLIKVDGIEQLQRQFKFNNFVAAMSFANKLTEIAEQQDHHPAILVEWGKATVTWWTHSIAGLHRNDFIMAAKTDQLLAK